MSLANHQLPLCPWVLVVGTRTRPYQPPPIDRAAVLYATPTTIRLGEPGLPRNACHHKHCCLPDASAWQEVQRLHQALVHSLEALAAALTALGTYSRRLMEVGGIKKHSAPLCSTVISAVEPTMRFCHGWFDPWHVPEVARLTVERHTPRMLQCGGRLTTQDGHFLCPTDADWKRIHSARAAAFACASRLKEYLHQLGTYAEARADNRHKRAPTEQTCLPLDAQLDLLEG